MARPTLQASDKLAFLLALVPYLIDHEAASVSDVAAHFGVSEHDVRDAVKLISISGIPGTSATYQHGDLFDIDWDAFENDDTIILTNLVAIDDAPRFSGREAAALIAGIQYLQALAAHGDNAVLASLITKLTRGASASPDQVAVDTADSDANVNAIREALENGTTVTFDYVNSGGERQRRTVDPLRLASVDSDWYLRGWCHLREAQRTFRLDRMTDAVATDRAAEHRPEDTELADTLFSDSPEHFAVTLDVSTSALPLIADYLDKNRATTSRGELERVTARFARETDLARLVASLPGMVSVVSPESARHAVAEWARMGLARYDDA